MKKIFYSYSTAIVNVNKSDNFDALIRLCEKAETTEELLDIQEDFCEIIYYVSVPVSNNVKNDDIIIFERKNIEGMSEFKAIFHVEIDSFTGIGWPDEEKNNELNTFLKLTELLCDPDIWTSTELSQFNTAYRNYSIG